MQIEHAVFINNLKRMIKNKENVTVGVDSGACMVYCMGKDKEDIMTSELPDIKTELKKQLQYHLGQAELIQKALNAIDPTAPATTATVTQEGIRRRIPWTKKVKEILKENREQEFSPQDIKEILISQGHTELESPNHKNTIYTTMKRMVDNGVLEKIATGLYKFKPLTIRRRKQPSNNEQIRIINADQTE